MIFPPTCRQSWAETAALPQAISIPSSSQVCTSEDIVRYSQKPRRSGRGCWQTQGLQAEPAFLAVGSEADSDRVEKLLSELEGKSIEEVVAGGLSKLASVPSGGGGGAAAAPAAAAAGGGGGGAAAAPAAAKEEEKEEEEEDEVGTLATK